MKRKTTALIIAFLLLFQYVNYAGILKQVDAASVGTITDDILSKVTLLDEDRTVIASVYDSVYNADFRIDPAADVLLSYEWEIKNDHGYTAGDTFVFTLPTEFKLYNNFDGDLIIDGDTVGTFEVTKASHEVLMTFNDHIEDHSNVRGTLEFWTEFDLTKISGSTTEEITFDINGIDKVLTILFKPQVSSMIEKKGTPGRTLNAKNINWTIDVNKALLPITNPVVADPTPDGLSFDASSIKVYNLNVNLNGSATLGAEVPGTDYTVGTIAGEDFTVAFNDTIETAYRIVYSTDIADGDASSFTNEATLSGDNIDDASSTATVSISRGALLAKSSTNYNSATQTIDWAIKYNYGEKNIDEVDAKLIDQYNDTQDLIPGSITIYKMTINDNGSDTVNGSALIVDTDYTVTDFPTAGGKNGFDIQFLNDIDSAYKITYQTKANDHVYTDTTISNTVTAGSESKTGTREIKQQFAHKTSNNPNYANKTVNWEIAINGNNDDLEGVVITDTFDKGGLEFIPGSLVVKEEDGTVISSVYTVSSPDTQAGFTLTFDPGYVVDKKYIISYTTAFNNDWKTPAGSSDYRFYNTGKLAWTEINGVDTGTYERTFSATFDPDDYSEHNGFKNGSYNAMTKEITWNIGVNYNKKEITDAVVVDTLQSEQELVADSLKVYHMNLTGAANGISIGAEVDSSEYEVNNGAQLSISFNNIIDSPYYITFKTTLEGELINDEVENTAVLQGDGYTSPDLDATVSIPQGGEYVAKTGEQDEDSVDLIHWTVYINRGQSFVQNAKIVDEPSENQILLEDTFHLFGTTVAPNGTVTKADELVKDTDYHLIIETDPDTGKQSFELSFAEDITSAYVLEYTSYSDAANGATVSNKVSFAGENVDTVTKETSEEVIIERSAGSGTGSGVTGSIVLTKVDSEDDSEVLEGAEFTLYRKSNHALVGTATTDDTGKLTFSNLLLTHYILKETKTPDGYSVIGSDEQLVTINSSAAKLILVENSKDEVIATPEPSISPSPSIVPEEPSASPSPSTEPEEPSASPSPSIEPEEPSASPSPSATPSSEPSSTSKPTSSPSPAPSAEPTSSPSPAPSAEPTQSPEPTPVTTPAASVPPAKEVTKEDTPITGAVEVPKNSTPSIGNKPENGKVSVSPDGKWVYTPNPGFVGKDQFSVIVTDENGNEEEFFFEIDVEEIPLGPIESAPDVSTLPKTGEDSYLVFQLFGLTMIVLGVAILAVRRKKSSRS